MSTKHSQEQNRSRAMAPASGPAGSSVLNEISFELHNLCQPLTALQCRLEIGRSVGGLEALRSAVDDGLEQTERMFEAVEKMRKCLLAQEPATQ